MDKLKLIKPKNGKEIPFLILISFLTTFVASRSVIYLAPDLFLTVRQVHIHHFAYGIILLSITNLLLLTQQRTHKFRLRLSIIYGISLGLAFDEFAMWIQLDNIYQDRSTYDVIIFISLVLLNIIYFDGFWRKWGHRLGTFLHLISTD